MAASAPASDDGMSSVSPDEIAARQNALDTASAEFLGAEPTGVYVDGQQLYTDGSLRPQMPPTFTTISVPETVANGGRTDDAGDVNVSGTSTTEKGWR